MPFDFRALEQEANRRWPLENMIGGYGGGGVGAWTKIVRPAGAGTGLIQAFHNLTNAPVGRLGFRYMPGRGPRLLDIKVNPAARGQGYGRELIEAFEQLAGSKMGDAGFAGSISNSPGFWQQLAQRWQDYPIGKGIKQALEWWE